MSSAFLTYPEYEEMNPACTCTPTGPGWYTWWKDPRAKGSALKWDPECVVHQYEEGDDE